MGLFVEFSSQGDLISYHNYNSWADVAAKTKILIG
jgi:hypothetical protein